MFIGIIKIVLIVFGLVAVLVGAFTIFNTLSITVAQRSREFGLLRMVGAGRRQVLGSVMLEALAIGVLASLIGLGAGFGIASGLNAVFDAMGMDLPSAGLVFSGRTIVVSLLVGTLVTLARRLRAGVAGDPRAARRRTARRRPRLGQGPPPGPRRPRPGLDPRPPGRADRRLGRPARAPQRDAQPQPHGRHRLGDDDRRRARHPGHGRGPGSARHHLGLARAARQRHPRGDGRRRLVADRPGRGQGPGLGPGRARA